MSIIVNFNYWQLCRGYMWNKIIVKVFQRLIAAHEYFQHAHRCWNNFRTPSVPKTILFQFQIHVKWSTQVISKLFQNNFILRVTTVLFDAEFNKWCCVEIRCNCTGVIMLYFTSLSAGPVNDPKNLVKCESCVWNNDLMPIEQYRSTERKTTFLMSVKCQKKPGEMYLDHMPWNCCCNTWCFGRMMCRCVRFHRTRASIDREEQPSEGSETDDLVLILAYTEPTCTMKPS